MQIIISSSSSVTGQKIELIQQLVSLSQGILVLLVFLLSVDVYDVVSHPAVLVTQTVVVGDRRGHTAALGFIDVLHVRVPGGSPLSMVS